MLKVLRNPKTKKNIFIILALVIIPPFVIWGVMTESEPGAMPNDALARYKGRQIPISEYLKSYKASQHQLMLTLGEAYGQIGSRINIKGEAFDRILLLDHAKREKISVTDREVVDWIGRQDAFRGKNGFDDRHYKLFCEQVMRIQPREFEEEVRQMLTLQKIGERVRGQLPEPSEDELKKADEKLFAENKETARTHYQNAKFNERMNALVEGLRKDLEINTATYEKLFPADLPAGKPATPASTEGPSTPS